MTKAGELRQKQPDELKQLLLDLRREQFNLRMQQGTGQTGRPSQIRSVRREIARIKTVLGEKPAQARPASAEAKTVKAKPAGTKAKSKAAKAEKK